jgi:hypothetical protein
LPLRSNIVILSESYDLRNRHRPGGSYSATDQE